MLAVSVVACEEVHDDEDVELRVGEATIGAESGCPMFHCDRGGTSNMIATIPRGPVALGWDDGFAQSPGTQGCSSSRTTFACVYRSAPPGGILQIFSTATGTPVRVGSSNAVAIGGSNGIAPIVTPEGDVIAADTVSTIRVAMDGTLRWQTPAPASAAGSANAFGPSLTSDDQIIVAYANGTITALDADQGTVIASAPPPPNGVGGFYRTVSPPAANGNRVYVPMTAGNNGGAPTTRGALLTYVADRVAGTLSVAWEIRYGGPTGASPYVDPETGAILLHARASAPYGALAPRLLAIEDRVTSGRVLWREPLTGDLIASPAMDPNEGAWVYPAGSSEVSRYGVDEGYLDTVDLADLWGGAPMEIIGHLYTTVDPNGAAMVTTVANATSGMVIGVDLDTRSLLWSVPVALTTAHHTGALPIVETGNDTSVVLVSPSSGGTGLGVRLLEAP